MNHSKPRRPPLVFAVALAVALVVIVVVSAAGSTPAACGFCHRTQAVKMASTGHASTRCYACHVDNAPWGLVDQKLTELLVMYPTALTGKGLVEPARFTSKAQCLDCHQEMLRESTTRNGLKIKHLACAPGPTCDTCHANVAHGSAVRWNPGFSMDACIACHTKRNAPVTCESCHVGSPGSRVRANGAWQVVHGANWKSTHGMGDQATCGTCHAPAYCGRCHLVPIPHPADFGAVHGSEAIVKPEACVVCHKSRAGFCDTCHGMAMPHPAGFLQKHSNLAIGESDPRCIRCHVNTDCTQCHANHTHPGGSTGVPVPWTQTPEERRP